MTLQAALAAIALLCGVVAGLATNGLLGRRLGNNRAIEPGSQAGDPEHQREPASSSRHGNSVGPRLRFPRLDLRHADIPRPYWQGFGSLLLNPLALGGSSLALAFLPQLQSPVALSQALLLLYVLYPLAILDAVTLTVEVPLVLGGLLLRMATLLTLQRGLVADMMGGMLGGAGLLYLVGFFYRWLRGREGLGEADAAVMGLIGAFVGWQGILPVILLATVAGLLIGFPLLLARRKPLHTPLPFGPYLCAAGLLVYLARLEGWTAFGLLSALG